MIRFNSKYQILSLMLIIFFSTGFLHLNAETAESLHDSSAKAIYNAYKLYESGRIAEAEHLSLKILAESKSLSNDQKFHLYKLLAFCSIANDDEESGKRHFIDALKYNSNMSPDPLTWSPKIRRVFDRARSEYRQQVVLEIQHQSEIEAQIGRRASLKSLYLPGSGQVMKGQQVRGYTLGVLCLCAASAYVYGISSLPAARDRYLDANNEANAEKYWKEYRDVQYFVNLTGILMLAVYGYTFFDALWSHPAEQDSISVK